MAKFLLLVFGISVFIVALPVILLLVHVAAPLVLSLASIIAVPVGIGVIVGYFASKNKKGGE